MLIIKFKAISLHNIGEARSPFAIIYDEVHLLPAPVFRATALVGQLFEVDICNLLNYEIVVSFLDPLRFLGFLRLSLLECSSPEQAASIATARKYQQYVLGLYSPTAVIVREIEKLRKLLEKQGIYPSPEVLDGESVGKRGMKDERKG
ncbi:hypothetical protein DEAC_c36210 [Desulfosporosinus acididurans]|uniref:Uncharacterized protein n=1 Tax=Desulfosporosinus acididurans TaxID=476652 RepID=A0A0J1FLL3_9FIRM|nr:hypothetical protein [Desulfosporosinus acididurans]KLU64419.1 hypothetical protein DEAC_c36210 [Desulfosporosinus acididurans]